MLDCVVFLARDKYECETKKEKLIAVGGGESTEITENSLKIIEKFLDLSGGLSKARIIVMTVATDDPDGARERYEKIFERLEFKNFEVVNIADRSESYDEKILDVISNATGLYFTGGNQLHVTALTGGTPLHQLILDKFNQGLIIGRTSAGAIMMSSSTLLSGSSDLAPGLNSIELAPGMDLLERSITDTHLSQRGHPYALKNVLVRIRMPVNPKLPHWRSLKN